MFCEKGKKLAWKLLKVRLKSTAAGEGKSVSDFVVALKQCSKTRDLEGGKRIHKQVKEHGFESILVISNTLVSMYSKCRSMAVAQEVFQRMTRKDVVTWNCLITGYVENGENLVALSLFSSMDSEPSHVTYVVVLKACAGLASESESGREACLRKGMAIHEQIKQRGFDSNIVVASTLVDMYSKCRNMELAIVVFQGMFHKDVVTWNCLTLGYVENGEHSIALHLFSVMDCEANYITYVAALKACAGLASKSELNRQLSLQKGVTIHKRIKERGLDNNILVASSLVDMYSKCRSMARARDVFQRMSRKDVVTWTCLILGYVENGECSTALELFNCMDCEKNHVTYVAALKACAGLAELDREDSLSRGLIIHEHVKGCGLESNTVVANTLIDMYRRCRSMDLAWEVFQRMLHKTVVTWNSLILGYVENGESSRALDLFTDMNCVPDCVTYVAVLKACGSLATSPVGKLIHSTICKLGVEEDEVIGTGLVDFYGKCGCMDIAVEVFNGIHIPSIVCWNALITGYSSLGDSSQVFRLVRELQEAGLQVNTVTLVCILTVCSHSGMVEEGKRYFQSCIQKHGIKHYTCLVDMLGRANRLEEALSIVNSMPLRANEVTWTSLLGACRKWKNAEVGKIAFDALVGGQETQDPAAPYMLMGDLYSNSEHVDSETKTKQDRETALTV